MNKNKLTPKTMLEQLLAGKRISCTGWSDHMFVQLGKKGLTDEYGLSADWSVLDDVDIQENEYWYIWHDTRQMIKFEDEVGLKLEYGEHWVVYRGNSNNIIASGSYDACLAAWQLFKN